MILSHSIIPRFDKQNNSVFDKMKLISIFSFALIALVVSTTTVAQDDLFLKNQIGDFGNIPPVDDPVEFSASFQLKTGTQQGVVSLTATVHPLWHVFSTTQKKGGPTPSTIDVAESTEYKLVGKFKADSEPHIIEEVEGFDVPVEEHEGTVTWSAPIELKKGSDPQSLKIKLVYNGQTCESKLNGSCRPLSNIDVDAAFAGFDDQLPVDLFVHKPVKLETYEPDDFHAELKGRVVRSDGTDSPILAGDKVRLELTAKATEDFHIYTYSLEPATDFMPTIVGFTETNQWDVSGPWLSVEPEKGDSFGTPVLWHHAPITWSFEFTIPKTADKETYRLKGILGMQACNAVGCDRPTGVKFLAELQMGKVAEVALEWVETDVDLYDKALEAIDSGGAAKAVPEADQIKPQNDDKTELPPENKSVSVKKPAELHRLEDSPEQIAEMAKLYDANEKIRYLKYSEMDANPIGSGGSSSNADTTFLTALMGAFLGGMLLNLMPCVFPVLGLKVMGFVQQAGSEPRKIRMHGIAFAAGLVVSMWILAGIIMTIRNVVGQDVNWGAQMGNPYFVVAIIVLLFVLGLNLAGVFEIGTSLSSVGGGQKKGYFGSFLSGILTTLIATPCSGPFLGVAMSYTMAQPTLTAMFLFTIFALGIALPYLILSFFPALIRMLPKPGPWMITFKVTMAFALFATVAFFMQAFGGQTGVAGLSWLAMALVVIGLATYFYGTWSENDGKSAAKRFGLGFVLPSLIAGVGLWMCYDAANQRPLRGGASHAIGGLAWQNWNPGKIEYSLANRGKIIWVDYTADW